MREIEVKIKVRNLAELEQKLGERGCVLSAPVHQHDVVYSRDGDVSPWEEMRDGHVVVRIRYSAGKAIFTLKRQRTHGLDNDEYETAVDDPAAFHRALVLMGFAPEVEVRKVRRKGSFGEYGVCLDQVEGLGNFIELECLTDEDVDPARVAELLLCQLESLGLSREDQERDGYDTQLFRRRSADR